MLRNIEEYKWKTVLENDQKLKELALKAGIVNDFKRAKELNYYYALTSYETSPKSEAERKIARYMFSMNDEDCNSYNEALSGRILAAKAAGISINDL